MQSADQRLADWERRYRAGETGWERGVLHPAFAAWRAEGLLPAGRVLVPGAGRAAEAIALAEAGAAVTAVDIAPTPARTLRDAARAAGVPIEVVQADLLSWEPGLAFDGVYEQTCLCALHPDYWEAYAARVRRWLAPGGRMLALFMQREAADDAGPPYHCGLDRMRGLFSDGWRWPDTPPATHPHSEGLAERAVVIVREG